MATHFSTLAGKSHGRRSLVGYSPWCLEESDPTERLHFHFSLSCIGLGNGNPLQCSCLENPRDRDWRATVHGVTKSWTQLSDFTHTTHMLAFKKCILFLKPLKKILKKEKKGKNLTLSTCCALSGLFPLHSHKGDAIRKQQREDNYMSGTQRPPDPQGSKVIQGVQKSKSLFHRSVL